MRFLNLFPNSFVIHCLKIQFDNPIKFILPSIEFSHGFTFTNRTGTEVRANEKGLSGAVPCVINR